MHKFFFLWIIILKTRMHKPISNSWHFCFILFYKNLLFGFLKLMSLFRSLFFGLGTKGLLLLESFLFN